MLAVVAATKFLSAQSPLSSLEQLQPLLVSLRSPFLVCAEQPLCSSVPVVLHSPGAAVPCSPSQCRLSQSKPSQSRATAVKRNPAQCSPQLNLVPCAATHLCAIQRSLSVALMADPTKEVAFIGPIPVAANSVPTSLSQPVQRVTNVLLNGKNFHAWSYSFQLYLDNYIILSWMFNSMEDRVYHMFMYHDTVHGLWIALNQMYAYARNESRIFELYRYISHASHSLPWDSRLQIILDISRLDGRNWPNFVTPRNPAYADRGRVMADGCPPRPTYLEPVHSHLKCHNNFFFCILNTSPLPSLYKAFAIVDGDEQGHVLLPSISMLETSFTILDQTTFVFNRNCGGGRVSGRGGSRGCATPRVSIIVEIEPMHAELPNLNQLQTQIAQLQSHLGLVLSSLSSSSGPMVNIATQKVLLPFMDLTSKKIFGKGYERDGLYYFVDSSTSSALSSSLQAFAPLVLEPSVFGSSSSLGTTSELVMEEDSAPPRPLPILESPSPSLSGSHAPAPLLASSSDFQVDYVSIPRSVHEALQNLLWVSTMKVKMDAF
ncbi:hypothetical protein Acr_00g0078600 [Actinidia rufa]|uniref:Uncharacterized protein n=1 Tax=Actinidia rufa TaxID=165716 RepID=A0A7J0DTK1_9ERIC|nr:hypothetical protein Acr_00g0078600 [Actinidia rufa]